MIWILLLYVLPLVISIVGAYYFVKQRQGDVKEFLEILPWLFTPLANILFIILGIVAIIRDWLKNDDNWQDFLNKKL